MNDGIEQDLFLCCLDRRLLRTSCLTGAVTEKLSVHVGEHARTAHLQTLTQLEALKEKQMLR